MHNEETADEEIGRSISLIDHGIKSLANLTFPVELLRINLHCNEIKRIENLGNLVNLRFLDLSSNEIKVIERLESLVNLQVLNLACNQIQMVTGLGPLRYIDKPLFIMKDVFRRICTAKFRFLYSRSRFKGV